MARCACWLEKMVSELKEKGVELSEDAKSTLLKSIGENTSKPRMSSLRELLHKTADYVGERKIITSEDLKRVCAGQARKPRRTRRKLSILC